MSSEKPSSSNTSEPQPNSPVPAQANPAAAPPDSGPPRKLDWRFVGIVLVIIALVVWWAASRRSKGGEETATIPHVAVAKVMREDLTNEVTIPAEFRPYAEVELHAKVSGYVDKINVDFGDKVKAGQLLATLEVPELHNQLDNALALQRREEADYTNAHQIYLRLKAVDAEHPNLVAEQDLETAQAKDSSTAAAIAAAAADVGRYSNLVAYTYITAPFDGVITRRYADPGALIQAGTASDTQSLPLVRVSDNYLLRLDFPVSVAYVKDMHVGDLVTGRIESLGGRSFTGKIARTTQKVTEDTRTMITEIEVPNADLEIKPGMYASVVLKVDKRSHCLAIPTEAVASGQNTTVYVVNDHQEIEERPVTLGLETPNKFEVVSGLREGELVMMGGRSMVRPGQKVETRLIGAVTQD